MVVAAALSGSGGWRIFSLALLGLGSPHTLWRKPGGECFPPPPPPPASRYPSARHGFGSTQGSGERKQESAGRLAASEGAAGAPESHAAGKLLQQTPNSTGWTGSSGPQPHCAAVGGQEGGTHLLQPCLPLAQCYKPVGKRGCRVRGSPDEEAKPAQHWSSSCFWSQFLWVLMLLALPRSTDRPSPGRPHRSSHGCKASGEDEGGRHSGETLSSWELTEAPSRESKLTLSLLGRGNPRSGTRHQLIQGLPPCGQNSVPGESRAE